MPTPEDYGLTNPTQVDYAKVGAAAASADFASASGTQGWEYDSEAMQALIKKLHGIFDKQRQHMMYDADNLTSIDPMGDEPVSQSYAEYGNSSGHSYIPLLKGSFQYLNAYIRTCQEIDQAYQKQDQEALDALRKQGL